MKEKRFVDKHLRINSVADRLSCSRPQVYKLVYEGKLSAIKIGIRGIRISEGSLAKFIADSKLTPEDVYTGDKYETYKN